MKCTNISELINKAIDFEMKTAEFYNKAADIVENEDASIMLRALRSQEVKHAKLLMDFHPEEHRELAADFEFDFSPDTLRRDFEINKSDNCAAIRRKAIAFERKSCKFFQNIATHVDEASVSQFFLALSKLEFDHIEIIQKELAGYYQ
jgi:hypothetical protein